MRERHSQALESNVTSFMAVKGRFTLDTNILIYAIYLDAGHKHDYQKLVVPAFLCNCVLTVQALGEFESATTRKNLLDISHRSNFVNDWFEVFEIVSATDSARLEAIDTVRNHQMSFWDAMLWATARPSGCSALLSEDLQDSWQCQAMEIINPFAADASARLENSINFESDEWFPSSYQ